MATRWTRRPSVPPGMPEAVHRPGRPTRISTLLLRSPKSKQVGGVLDVGGSFGPATEFGLSIPVAEPFYDCGFEAADTLEAAAAMPGPRLLRTSDQSAEPLGAARREV
jgi:hypothetical protein